jgi:hypothetical protein
MVKILFIIFQGWATNLKFWNEYTKSKFLDRLKTLGYIYTYQDKTNNIFHYEKSNPEHIDFDSDINFNLSYINPNTHIKMIYDDICLKYKNIEEYKFIPIGWSLGSGLSLYFSQKYSKQCIHCIILDPLYITKKDMPSELKDLDNTNITNTKLQKILNNLKKNNTEENLKIVENTIYYIIYKFYNTHLDLKLLVKTTSFINIENPEEYKWQKDNNKNRLNEIKILKKLNPDNFSAIIFENKTHMIYDKIQPAKKIIKYIDNLININQ